MLVELEHYEFAPTCSLKWQAYPLCFVADAFHTDMLEAWRHRERWLEWTVTHHRYGETPEQSLKRYVETIGLTTEGHRCSPGHPL